MYGMYLKGDLYSEKGLGNFSTKSVYFVSNVLIILLEMGRTIAFNGARPNVNDSVNSYLVYNKFVYINVLRRFQ